MERMWNEYEDFDGGIIGTIDSEQRTRSHWSNVGEYSTHLDSTTERNCLIVAFFFRRRGKAESQEE